MTETSKTVKTLIGKGVLSWPASERRSDRYGTIMLMEDGMNSLCSYEGPVLFSNQPPEGIKVRLFAVVTETRQSTHIGDLFRGLRPSTPEIGERIDFGEGVLFYDTCGVYPLIGLRPEDGRDHDWLNPEILYHAHEQTVELYCEYE